ncbi:hypothetical protein B0H67DRAFT_500159 [Lasiosphaeris hirsuta]|uniref:Uncharacterized protein n=1 Tax=Lasiosphaeris hirsuta TaxID=260670 RepID=A0AA39ZR79_9PEZI|nr:hypothetical protein B0H67DRAFT_500159 [Lasiosphaeris hirsuta]
MASPNAFISNGTCYVGPGDKAADVFFPCGNDALGHKTCCGAGDMCLSSKACYNAEFGVTYLTGCSDPEFTDSNCPVKGAFAGKFPIRVGLVYCNGSSEHWVACSQHARETTLSKPDFCYCPETSRTIAFTDMSRLANVVLLPSVPGQSVVWQVGYVPSFVTHDTSPTITSSLFSATSAPTKPPPTIPSSTLTASPEPSASPSAGSGLPTGTKAGIGVGAGLGSILILAALTALYVRCPHRHTLSTQQPTHNGKDSSSPCPQELGGPDTPRAPATSVPSELDSNGARPWSLRSELPQFGTVAVRPEILQGRGARNERMAHSILHQGQAHGRQAIAEMSLNSNTIAELPA